LPKLHHRFSGTNHMHLPFPGMRTQIERKKKNIRGLCHRNPSGHARKKKTEARISKHSKRTACLHTRGDPIVCLTLTTRLMEIRWVHAPEFGIPNARTNAPPPADPLMPRFPRAIIYDQTSRDKIRDAKYVENKGHMGSCNAVQLASCRQGLWNMQLLDSE